MVECFVEQNILECTRCSGFFCIFVPKVQQEIVESEEASDISNLIPPRTRTLINIATQKTVAICNISFGPNLPMITNAHLDYISPTGEMVR